MNTRKIGFEAELKAIDFLKKNGFERIQHSHSNTPFDIKAFKNDEEHFIEVKKTKNKFVRLTQNEYNFLIQHQNNYLIIVVNDKEIYEKNISEVKVVNIISVSGVPIELLKELDSVADRNKRDRSKEIIFALEKYLRDVKEEQT